MLSDWTGAGASTRYFGIFGILRLFALIALIPGGLRAATILKNDTALNLNLATSWVTNGPPGAADVARFDSNVTASVTSAALGANLSWDGIQLVNPGAATFAINVGSILTLGLSGIDMSTATKALTLNCDVTLGATQTWNVATSRILTVGGAVSGTADIIKSGPGTAILSVSNTFSGKASVIGGLLTIAADNRLGTPPAAFSADAITLNGGTLRFAGTFTLDPNRGITLGPGLGTIDGNSGTMTIPGPLTGPAAFSKVGATTLILTGTNTYDGTTTIATGELRANDGIGIATNGNVTLSGGVWETSADITRAIGTGAGQLQITTAGGFCAIGGAVVLNFGNAATPLTWGTNGFAPASTLTLNNASGNSPITLRNDINLNSASARTITVTANAAEISGAISNTLAGGLTKNGAGRLILTGTNTCTGTTTLSAGALRAGEAAGLAPGNLTISAGVFEPIGNLTRTLGTGANQVQLTAGASGFSANGANVTVTITNAPVWGSASFSPTTLILNAADATHNLVLASALDLNGVGRIIQVNTNSAEISGVISHAVNSSRLQKTGNGTLILSGSNTWSHTGAFATNLHVSAGTLQVSQEENLGGTSASFQPKALMLDGGTLRASASFTIDDPNRGITLGGSNGRFNVDAGTTLTIMTPIAGATGILHKDGAGTLLLAATNTWGANGNFIQLHAGALAFNEDANLGIAAADLLADGDAALFATGTTTLNSGRAISMNTNLLVSVTNAATLTIDGVLNELAGSSGVLIKTGAGTLILTAANLYNGATVVQEGTLQTSTSERIANTTPLRVSGGTFDLQSFNETVAAVTLESGSIIASGGTLTGTVYNVESGTIGARLGGNGALNKSTAGTVTLTAANVYTGGTTINDGTLLVNNAAGSGTGTGTVTVAAGTLGGTGTIVGAVTVNGGATLAPGTSIGTLTVSRLTLAGGAQLAFEFNGGSNDTVIVTNLNGFTVAGSAGVYLYTEGGTNGWTAEGRYNLVQYSGSLGGVGVSGFSVLNPQPGVRYGFGAANGWMYVVLNTNPIIGVGDISVTEGNAGTTSLVFPVSIGTPFGTDVSFTFSTSDGTAKTVFNDYAATNGSATIFAGATDTQIVVQVTGDMKFETNETLTVTLTNAVNAILLAGTATGTIVEDDSQGGIWYVDDTAMGLNNGYNWDDGFTNLQSALVVANSNQIWVAAGIYTPGVNRTDTFQLKNGVTVYGGFAGNETTLEARDWEANLTVLSGDIGTPSVPTDNSEHILTGENNAGLDGFQIADAYSGGNGGGMQVLLKGPMTVRHCTFTNNFAAGIGSRPGGGAIYFQSAAATGVLTIDGCRFLNNATAANGGGILINGLAGNIRIDNCIFVENQRGLSWGGDVANTSGSLASMGLILNCTFVNPQRESLASGILGVNPNPGHLKLVNCILWKDGTGTNVVGRVMNSAQITLDTCLIDGVWDISPTTGGTVQNMGTVYTNDPQFVDLPTRDLRLQYNSPAIDVGVPNTTPSISMPTVDFLGNPRPAGPAYDLGAYEGGVVTQPPTGLMFIVR